MYIEERYATLHNCRPHRECCRLTLQRLSSLSCSRLVKVLLHFRNKPLYHLLPSRLLPSHLLLVAYHFTVKEKIDWTLWLYPLYSELKDRIWYSTSSTPKIGREIAHFLNGPTHFLNGPAHSSNLSFQTEFFLKCRVPLNSKFCRNHSLQRLRRLCNLAH